MLQIIHAGAGTHVKHTDPAIITTELVPSRREAIEALGKVEGMIKTSKASISVNCEIQTIDEMFDVLRRFVLTR